MATGALHGYVELWVGFSDGLPVQEERIRTCLHAGQTIAVLDGLQVLLRVLSCPYPLLRPSSQLHAVPLVDQRLSSTSDCPRTLFPSFRRSVPICVGVEFVAQGQYLCTRRDVAHAVPVVYKAGYTGLINEHLRRHPSELEQLDFLSVQLEHAVFGIGQANERQRFLLPVLGECSGIFGTNNKHFDVTGDKLGILLAQLRHVRAAERSHEAAIEH
jgi:hypothetical protein